jgi:DNA-binding PadR family transcriptional regulator
MLGIKLLTGFIAVYIIVAVIRKNGRKNDDEIDGEIDEISEIAEKMGKSMRKGFLSSLVLIVLKNEPAHGYKLIQEIKKRTKERWVPTAASMYPLLKSFTDKGLIRIVEQDELVEKEKESERPTKTYVITPRGEELIQMLGDKQRDLVESIMNFMLTSRKDIEDLGLGPRRGPGGPFGGKFPSEEMFNRMNENMDSFMKNIPREQKLPILNNIKQFMMINLQKIEENLQQIEKEIK